MEIIDFYNSLLRAVGCTVLENAEVHRNYFGELSPIRVSGKQLVLPTVDILRAGNWDGKIAFHPVCESATRSESAVFKELRNMMTIRASAVIADVMMQLMSIAVNKDCHASLSADQAQFLTQIPHDVNENTLTKLTAVINATSPKSEHRLITMFPKRAGKLDGVEYRRLAVVEFPVLAAKAAEELRIFGVAMGTKRDKNAVIKLMEYVFPDAESKEYCAGSQDLSAPGFLALCAAYGKVMNRLNHIVQLFRDLFEDVEELVTEMGWWDGLALIDKYRAAIPPLSGNDGDPIADNLASGNAAIAATQAPSVPVVNNTPAPAASTSQTLTMARPEKKHSFADFIAPINSNDAGKPAKQEQGTVYKEEPPVAVNQFGRVVQPASYQQSPVNSFAQAPAGWPANSGYVPANVPQQAYAAPAPAYNAPAANAFAQAPAYGQVPAYGQAPAPAVQLVRADHLLGQFPVPPQFGLAMEMPSQQLVVIAPTGQPLGYYNIVMPQLMQQAAAPAPVAYGQAPAYPAPNQGGFVGRNGAAQMLQQKQFAEAQQAYANQMLQANQWGGMRR